MGFAILLRLVGTGWLKLVKLAISIWVWLKFHFILVEACCMVLVDSINLILIEVG